ncbi:alpha-1,3-mannosyl-glycoprotein 2-beta-N-acetylglucosaminyltransferase-like isoform X2 [Mizuhopecten yessoensis]|uniref:alpha-1,3-mannosyl-glycoprotein 2-beta-N-acetylglucosaminyltransferase-like isoform X2 n=1 Tax=Mizuhopecten yessoensis TaxID=6573 RepID=UPI000B45DE60|nr:alpha-1,3-mannosyl-glycoprotein 2-beta-N-acetylglucosaminyltransferase-like isoform X2 [Mizuhopecten yessoensis]
MSTTPSHGKSWNVIMYYVLMSRHPRKASKLIPASMELDILDIGIQNQLRQNLALLTKLQSLRNETERNPMPNKPGPMVLPDRKGDGSNLGKVVLPVLMIACDRVTVSRSLDQLIKHRTTKEQFPIIVSQDCANKPTSDVIQKYVTSDNVIHIKHPNQSNFELNKKDKKFVGYYKIARHYKWALDQVFFKFNYSTVIIVEDDLDIAPDFFEYFSATYPILTSDPSVWCVSAWNDNGKNGMVSDEPELLYRSDFFPGLGWMMEKKIWLELGPKWPIAFWDDWMRYQDQRKERVCIRPEICRTSTFGKKGVSKGLFYEKHLKHIKLNDKFVAFTKKDLSYLSKKNYDPWFTRQVYDTPEVTVAEVMSGSKKHLKALRVTYTTKDQYKTTAKKLGIMDDFKAGVPRVAYRGVVSFIFHGQRIYLAPKQDWQKYDPKWT